MKSLREKALRARRALHDEAREVSSKKICQQVIRSRVFFASRTVGCYLPMHDEVDTRDVIERAWCANKRIFVPILRKHCEILFRELRHNSTLVRNSFGIWEPVSGELIEPRALDIVITPTVAFDRQNNRIGMGSGYYDRCFSFLRHREHWLRPKLVGVAFACQEVEKITPNPWDIRLYSVFSDKT